MTALMWGGRRSRTGQGLARRDRRECFGGRCRQAQHRRSPRREADGAHGWRTCGEGLEAGDVILTLDRVEVETRAERFNAALGKLRGEFDMDRLDVMAANIVAIADAAARDSHRIQAMMAYLGLKDIEIEGDDRGRRL
jgi:hypothetical protein